MRQADLRVGSDYAYPTSEPWDGAPTAARVRIVSVDGGGAVTVQVVDAGAKVSKSAWSARPVKRNQKLQVRTRDIACPWSDWAERAEKIGAEKEARVTAQRAWRDEYERERADRVAVDPGRVLPDEYDDPDVDAETEAKEREALRRAYVRARGFGPHVTIEELTPLLVDLPIPVLRDVLAADAHRRPGDPGTVAAVYVRAAWLLEVARVALKNWPDGGPYGDIPQPGRVFHEADEAFVHAVRNKVADSGGELLLPPVPPMPVWLDERRRTVAPVLGWLRLVVGDTGGQMLHSPACQALRSRRIDESDHRPWW